MSQFQRLLLVADPQLHHSTALQRAAALAQASGAALHILSVLEPPPALPLLDHSVRELTREARLQACQDWLKDEVELLRSKGLEVTSEVLWSDQPLKEILVHVAEMPVDLLIKDLQHELALKRAFVTPLDWHLLRECPAPVHLVGATGNPLPRKVVASVDLAPIAEEGKDLNQRIIEMANGLALQCDAELHLLHVCDLSPTFLAEAGTATAVCVDMIEELRQTQGTSFTALAQHYGVPAERRHFLVGSPIHAIAEFAASNQADVLVMGRVQRKGLDKLVGSTTEHLLYRAPCSILTIAL
nr:universal stress protein [uncultured Pseudomonas sp.]